ncbi:MAG TPA: MarR family transcriptional regulator [Planctomycetota bacterium]|nr:MarR family transcriptional regulator [Planctomycetota bacterium]
MLAFMQLLWSIDRGMRTVSAEMHSKLGVTGPERLILRMVGRRPEISAGQLARLLRRHPSSLTGALDRLTRRGMLSSVVDPNDRRRVILTLTAAGRRVDRLETGTLEAAMRRTLARVPAGSLSTASRVLAVIAAGLTPDVGNP